MVGALVTKKEKEKEHRREWALAPTTEEELETVLAHLKEKESLVAPSAC
jgi:hypothetical protein